MSQIDLAQLLERMRRGLPTVVVGRFPLLPTLGADFELVRVRCELASTHGPLERARRRIERLLEDGSLEARRGMAERAAFGASEPRTPEERFAAACNRLAARAPGRVALVLDAVDRADAATHAALARLLGEPGKLRLPLILVVREEPCGTMLEVVDAVRRASGGGHVPAASFASPEPMRAPSAVPERRVDPRLFRVLRAAAVAGDTFDAATLARLLDLTEQQVLEALQDLRDTGAPIEDDGDGHLAMPEDLRAWLLATTLPSLRKQWHGALGELYGKGAAPDPLRSAAHLTEAGERAAALERRLDAVAALARTGDPARAATLLASLGAEIVALPRGPLSAAMRARATLESARIAWLGGDSEPALTLAQALETALSARAELGATASAEVRADAASTIAGIAYDLGDGASLERAEGVVAETIASLTAGSEEVLAATLLNDQAGLALRMGQRLRAVDLVGRARGLLVAHLARRPDDEIARRELADAYHLLARLPLHAIAGREGADAAAGALEHVRASEAAYRQLGLRRDVGRAIDTRARLEARRGNIDAARAAFAAAFDVADEAGDLTGLARTTAGLAELFSSAGSPREALDMLGRSIELNREKASPVGLAFDERVLDEIERTLGELPAGDLPLRDELVRVRRNLASAIEATS